MATDGVYTVRDMCTEALRECGVVSISTTASAEDMDVAVKRLNMMLKAWQNTAITIWKQTSGSITITDATASYAIAARPLRLDTVARKDGTETPMTSMTRQEYSTLPDKDSAGTPSSFWYHRELSAGRLYVWPVMATGSGTIEWYGVSEVEDVTTPNDALDVPGEWYEATLYNLAYRLLGAFPGVPQERTQYITANAVRSLAEAKGGDAEESIMFQAASY